MLPYFIKKLIPQKLKSKYNKRNLQKFQNKIKSLKPLSEIDFEHILSNEFALKSGDIVFVHSSLNGLNLTFPGYKILEMLLEKISDDGTVLFPTYPAMNSYEFLKSNTIFDIRKTPTHTGLLNELARRHKNAIRSLHPTKSVVAIGKYAEILTNTHHRSIYPYDVVSPYYKISELNAKIIGIGVSSNYLSCVHCVDDILKEDFPVIPYHKKVFAAKCIDYEGNSVIVETLAHNMAKMDFNIPKFIKKYVPPSIARDFKINGMDFFIADSQKFINFMIELAINKITIYHKRHYKLKFLI